LRSKSATMTAVSSLLCKGLFAGLVAVILGIL
jgi:hypothetical protein